MSDIKPENELVTYFRVIRRRWRLMMIVLAVCAVLGAGWAAIGLMLNPEYEASALFIINKSASVSDTQSLLSSLQGSDSAGIETQIGIMKSPMMAEAVSGMIDGKLSGDILRQRVRIEPIENTAVIEVAAWDRDPALAKKIADSYIKAYIAWSVRESGRIMEGQKKAIGEEFSTIQSDAGSLLKSNDPQIKSMIDKSGMVGTVVGSLYQKSVEIDVNKKTKKNAYQIINWAEKPGSPARPRLLLSTVAGLFIGLIAAVLAAVTMEAVDKLKRLSA